MTTNRHLVSRKLSFTLAARLPLIALILVSLLAVAGCQAEPTPTPTAEPTPTAVPTPTPSPEDYIARVARSFAALSTAKFGMSDETETGAKFFGTTFKSMEAEVEAPDSLRMLVNVVAPGFGFVAIEIVQVGDAAFLKLSADAPWSPLPPDQVPFNFAGIGTVFAGLPDTIADVTVTGREEVQGAQAVRVEGVIDSGVLLPLITTADPGRPITLTLWIDETDYVLRQMRLAGQIYDEDAPETTRLLTIENINEPVDIQLPEAASGQ